MINDPILSDLNPAQLEAVLSTEGPLLVLAGAGSGKTRVITRRIAYLIGRKGVSPGEILAVTFTNKAAGEMKRRVSALLQLGSGVWGLGSGVWVGTFHATCVRILRRHAHEIGLPNSFLIYDEGDQLALLRECLKELDLSEKALNPRMLASRISRAKAELLGPSEYALVANDFLEERVAKLYRLYQERLRRLQALDFDDLLGMTVLLFEERPEVLRAYQVLWRYLMVDEYQDTNPAQYRLIHLLAGAHRNLCAVGDDDQAIYGFRGADLSNILDFERDYPGCKVIRLEQNYRSTQRILDAAGSVIAHNLGRKGKRLWTANGEGERILVYQAEDEEDEARFIAERIKTLSVVFGRGYDEMAVFYRVNAQSRALEEAFRRFQIPYVIVGGLRFYERREIKDMLAYLRLIANPGDEASLRRIINVPPRGIGEGTLEHLTGIARAERISLWEACSRAVEGRRLPKKPHRALRELFQLIERYRETLQLPIPPSVPDLLLGLMKETGYVDHLMAEGTPEAQARMENLRELVAAAQAFDEESEDKGLQAYLDSVALLSDADEYREGQGAVTLMTLHMAKGLEFPIVFICGMEEGIFPHIRSMTDEGELEEERRLCYVGMTRAKERLHLTLAARRRLYKEAGRSLPSRFLEEIPPALIERVGSMGSGPPLERPAPAHEPFVDHLRPGMRVRHPEWGIGIVRERIGQGEDLKVTVAFPGLGVKKLLARYANLEQA